MNYRPYFLLGATLAFAVPAAAQDISKSDLRDDLKRRFDAALLASRDGPTINSDNPRYLLAIEAKAHCEIALGYLKAGKREDPSIAKCRTLSDRMEALPADPDAASAGTDEAADGGAVVTMQDAISTAMATNPEIIQAQLNKEATEFERQQAEGLFYPQVNVEMSYGARQFRNATRRNLGIANDKIYPREVNGRADWTLIDFGRRKGELMSQAARVDGASLRVAERSELIALQIAQVYLDVLLQQRVVAASADNTAFHRALAADLTRGVDLGSMSIADQQQAEERLQSAIVREEQGRLDLERAQNSLRRLTGLDVSRVVLPPDLGGGLPASRGQAIGLARLNNPLVLEAQAEVDAADAMVKAAEGELLPSIGIDLTSRRGQDIDGFAGYTDDLQGRIYLRWNIFDGGIGQAKLQEMIRRASQARFRLNQVVREVEQDVANAWAARQTQGRISQALGDQSQISDRLLYSYRKQFVIGRRSLLDVLDAQNARYNTQVQFESARFARQFAEYQSLAAVNRFLETLGIAPGDGTGTNERGKYDYGPPDEPDASYRRYAD